MFVSISYGSFFHVRNGLGGLGRENRLLISLCVKKQAPKLLPSFLFIFPNQRVLSPASNLFTSSDRAPTIGKGKQLFDENYTYY